MKKFRSALYASFVIFALIMGLAFTTEKKQNVFTSKTFYYVDAAAYQRLESGYTTGSLKSRSLSADPNYGNSNSQFRNVNNWSEDPLDCTATLYNNINNDQSSYLFSFTITSWEQDSDGDDDGFISLDEALIAIYAYYVNSGGVLPSGLTVDANHSGGTSNISNITRAENAH